MINEYSHNRSNVVLNFTNKYCKTPEELLQSTGFKKVLRKYVKVLLKKDALLLDRIEKSVGKKDVSNVFLELFKLLIILDTKQISDLNAHYKNLLESPNDVIDFIEGFYDYWRGLERYALILTDNESEGIQNVNFIEANNDFSNLILRVYRRIVENIKGDNHNVYRQLTAGVNAGLVLTKYQNKLPNTYRQLQKIHMIKRVIFTPPFIIYPKKNTRSGVFEEVYENPIDYIELKSSHFFCYPAKVGGSLTFIYFHRDFMNHGVSLSNLFELAKPEEYQKKQPSIVLVFGARLENEEKRTVYYQDDKNDIMFGYVSNTEEVDYFGYMKKMILTLHNTAMLNRGYLPIHGAMVNVTMKNGKQTNIAIVGDSGAGKSESLEAFRKLSDAYLKEIKIVFDDMGTFKIENGNIYGYGTETGAFVRLDDLEMGYSFKEMDRAIFMNPHRINARLILPLSNYETIMHGYKVDILLYANNYQENTSVLTMFQNEEDAKTIFVQGKRKAKGTTSESGVVDSFFANPFGPVQRQNQSLEIIDRVFKTLFDKGVPVGQIYTKLGIDGFERKGPEEAAKELFEWLKNK
jgi:hypothetical protein